MEYPVVIKKPIQFVQGYDKQIETYLKTYQQWNIDNLKYDVNFENSYILHEETVYFKFIFNTEEDAIAFKLKFV